MDKDTESTFIRHEPCPSCGSSDGCSLYSDGHRYCFVCDSYFPSEDNDESQQSKKSYTHSMEHSKMSEPVKDLADAKIMDLPARKISKDTCSKYSYYVGRYHSDKPNHPYEGKPCQIACYINNKGKVVGQKFRFADKSFLAYGNFSNILFGANLWSSGKILVVTEGEIDCLSAAEANGCRYPTVSIPTGASGAKKAIEANLEYFDNFDKIVLMFDMDEKGREASEACASILPLGKAYIATLPLKDANECLKANKANDIIQAIFNAKPYRPDGIVSGTDLLNDCTTNLDEYVNSVPYPWESLNTYTRGVRLGELVVITSGSGMGKSTLMRELEYYFGVTKNEKCGIIALEESTRKTGLELMSLHVNKRLALDPNIISEQERLDAFNATIGNGNYYLYDHFGSLESDNLLNKIRYMIVGLGCKRIFLDHISIVVSGMDSSEDGGERKAIDKLMTNLRALVEETNVSMFIISHLRRAEKKGHEDGGQISLSQLRGSGAIAQLSDIVIGLERDQQGEKPNELLIRILKNRFSGETGYVAIMYYNRDTGRLENAHSANEDLVSDVANDFKQHNDFEDVPF